MWEALVGGEVWIGDAVDFVSELKQVSIKLHTKDQAKKGEQETTQKPFQKVPCV